MNMSTSPRKIASLFTALALLSGSAWAASSIVQGDVKGPDGKALSGAEVRLQRKGDKASAQTAKTDARGRYAFKDLRIGSYDLTASANGMAATAAQNVGTTDRGAVSVNFNLKTQTGAAATALSKKKAKKLVWMEPEMGSHLGGRWVEVNDDGTSTDSTHTDSVKKQDSLRKMLSGGGMNPHGN